MMKFRIALWLMRLHYRPYDISYRGKTIRIFPGVFSPKYDWSGKFAVVRSTPVMHLPLCHRLGFARPAHDLGGPVAISGGKDDLGAPHMLLWRAGIPATIASSRRRSTGVTLTTIPALMRRT
jgi:hypothetical protein